MIAKRNSNFFICRKVIHKCHDSTQRIRQTIRYKRTYYCEQKYHQSTGYRFIMSARYMYNRPIHQQCQYEFNNRNNNPVIFTTKKFFTPSLKLSNDAMITSSFSFLWSFPRSHKMQSVFSNSDCIFIIWGFAFLYL